MARDDTPCPVLRPGDLIGVMAPSSYVERDDVEASQAYLEARGYRVYVHPQTYARHNQSAGTSAEKVQALHDLYNDENIGAIWAAGGGNRALHIVDSLDYELIKRNPKPMVGFSDVTALLNAIYARSGVSGVHGPVFKQVHSHAHSEATLAMLESGQSVVEGVMKAEILRGGVAKGRIIGGNLSLFHYITQGLPQSFSAGAVLWLEDCHEELSRIDRMFMHLKRQGVLGRISGLVLGEFIDMRDSARPFGFDLRDIVMEHMEGVDVPIAMNAPFGHGETLSPMRVGGDVDFNMTKDAFILHSP